MRINSRLSLSLAQAWMWRDKKIYAITYLRNAIAYAIIIN